jgi:tetratricopeptide (TPR) repeat protein
MLVGKHEWYRRKTWAPKDREEFNARLARSRGSFHKSQYLCIQAGCLAEAGQHTAAIELIDRFFSEFPDQRTQLASAHVTRAECLNALGEVEAALKEYRAALRTERKFPHSRTDAWLDFGWLIVNRQLTDLYREAAKVLKEFREDEDEDEDLIFPAREFRYCAIQAVLADARGDRKEAQHFAREALAQAKKKHSGLRYHARTGLVGNELKSIEGTLKTLAGK